MSANRRVWIATAALLAAITFAAYSPVLRATYSWDDDEYVTNNFNLQSVAGLWRIWAEPRTSPQYYPLVFTSFWLEYHLWGLAPVGYHTTNLVLHIINALILWRLLREMALPGAGLAAAVFALHPVHVESVAWIAERKDVLSGMFALWTVLTWIRFVRTQNTRSYCLALLSFLAALTSKTTTCGLPIVLVLIAWWQAPKTWTRTLPHVVPFFILSGVFVPLTVWREHLGTRPVAQLPPLSVVERGLLAGRALWFYVATILWPTNLMTIYPRWQIDAEAAWQYVPLAAATAVIFGCWSLRERFGAGSFVALLTFVLLLAPSLGIVDFDFQRFSFVADHFQYLASLAPIALLAVTATSAFGRIVAGRPSRAVALCAPLIAVLACLTWRQSELYADAKALWRDNLVKNPLASLAHYNLGTLLLREGKPDEAIERFASAVRIDPQYADAYGNWGTALNQRGDADSAIAMFAKALEIDPGNPTIHYNFGNALKQQGRFSEAIREYTKTLEVVPDAPDAHNNLGVALASSGQLQEAKRHFREAARLQPDSAEVHINWGIALETDGELSAAIEQYQIALRIRPDFRGAEESLRRARLRLRQQSP